MFLKIVTSEPGLYGIGSANNLFQSSAVIAALEDYLKPWLIGKDPCRVEDLWQSAQMRTYWRSGPVNNNVLAAMDTALWDIKGKRAGMPVYEMLGGKAHDSVAVCDHQGGQVVVCVGDRLSGQKVGFDIGRPAPFTLPTDSVSEPNCRGPGLINFNTSLIRNIRYRERYNLQLRFES